MRSRHDRRLLSNNRKASEAGRLIVRKKYPQIPPKEEFSLSECDKTLMKVLTQLCVQGSENRLPGEQALCGPQKPKRRACSNCKPASRLKKHLKNAREAGIIKVQLLYILPKIRLSAVY